MGAGYLELNPDLKQLQDKVSLHLKKTSSKSPTKTIKSVETIKDENGEIVDIKETLIEQKIDDEEDVYQIQPGMKGVSKLSQLKQSLMLKLKAERVERFMEEKAELEADQAHDEENYLNDELDKIDDQIDADEQDNDDESGDRNHGVNYSRLCSIRIISNLTLDKAAILRVRLKSMTKKMK